MCCGSLLSIMADTNRSERRQTLKQLGRLGAVFLGYAALPVNARTPYAATTLAAAPAVSTTTNPATARDKSSLTHPERLIGPIADLNAPLDHWLVNPATKRKIGLRIRLPVIQEKTGLILYSPGLGGSLDNGSPWCEAWRKAGFVVVTLSHPVTNNDIWDISKKSLTSNLRDALAYPQYGLRVTDCKYVVDVCLADADLKNRIDPGRIGIAGHSYGALTVQSMAGQANGANKADPRIKAAIAFSPTAMSATAANTMKAVKIPFFCITGDRDEYVTFKNETDAMRLGVTLTKRKLVYQGLPPGKREQLVLANADHMSFAGEDILGEPSRFSRDITTNAEQENKTWEKISQVSTLFWLMHLRKNISSADLNQYREAIRQKIGKEDEYTVD